MHHVHVHLHLLRWCVDLPCMVHSAMRTCVHVAACDVVAGGWPSVVSSEWSPYPSCFECECVRDKGKWSPWQVLPYSKTCQGDHSDKAITCPRRPLKPGPRDAISSQMNLDKETTLWLRPPFEGPLSGRLRQVSLYEIGKLCDPQHRVVTPLPDTAPT